MKKFILLLLLSLSPLFGEIFVENTKVEAKVVDQQAFFNLSIEFKKIGTNWESFKILPKNVQILEQTGEHILKRVNGSFFFYIEKPGQYTSHFKLSTLVSKDQEYSVLRFPFSPGPVSTFNLTLPHKELEVLLDPQSFLLSQQSKDGKTQIQIAPSPQLEIKWQPAQPKQTLETLTSAKTTTLIQFLEGEILYQTTTELQVIRGSLEKIEIELPENQKLLKVIGANFKWWKLNGNVLALYFQEKVSKKIEFNLILSQLYQDLPTQLTLKPANFRKVSWQNGTFVLQKGVVSLKEIQAQDMEREDVAEFKHLGQELISAYQFRGKKPELTIEIKKRPPQIKLQLHSTVQFDKEEVHFQTFAHFTVTESEIEQLTLTLPKELQLHSLREVALRSLSKRNEFVKGAKPVLRSWEQKQDKIYLKLKERRKGRISFLLEGQIEKTKNLPQMSSSQAKEISGKIGISYANELKLLVIKAEEITQVNTQALPKELQREQPKLAFSFGNKPFLLEIKPIHLTPQLSTTVTTKYELAQDGTHFQANYQLTLKEVGIFDLEIPLPKQLEITDVIAPRLVESWNVKESTLILKFFKETRSGAFQILGLFDSEKEPVATVFFPKSSQKNEGYIALDPEEDLAVTIQKFEDLEEKPRAEMRMPLKTEARVFKIIGKKPTIRYKITSRTPEITATFHTLHTFVRGYVVAQSEVEILVEKAGIRKLSINFPSKAGNLIVTGDAVRDFYPRENDYQIEFKNKMSGSLRLFINYDIPFNIFGESLCKLDGVDILSAKKVSGFESWKKSEIPIEILLEKQEGYERNSDRIRFSPSRRFKLARDNFTIKDRNRSIQFKIKGLDQTQIQEVQISDLNIKTEINPEGKLTTRLTCRFNNTTRQFLRVRVDKRATLWGTYIDNNATDIQSKKQGIVAVETERNKPVKPTIGKEGEILIPIPKNVQDAKLEMVFVDQMEKMGHLGDLDLISPTIEEAHVEKLEWDLVVPKDYLLVRHEGAFDLKPVHSSLLPDSFATRLQEEISRGLRAILPRFIFAGIVGLELFLTGFLLFSILLLLFYGYKYLGPDSFLALCLKIFFGIAGVFLIILTYREDPVICYTFCGVAFFGWALYKLRDHVVDMVLTTNAPSKQKIWILIITAPLLLIGIAIFSSNQKALFQGANSTFKDGRSFSEMSKASSYDYDGTVGSNTKHRTGRMEGESGGSLEALGDRNSSRGRGLVTKSEQPPRKYNVSKKAKKRMPKSQEVLEEKRDLADKESDEYNDDFASEEEEYETLERSKNSPEPSTRVPADPAAANEGEYKRENKNTKGMSTGKSKQKAGEKEYFGYDQKDKKPDAEKKLRRISQIDLAKEKLAIEELTKEVRVMTEMVQSGDLDNLGIKFSNTFQKANQPFVALKGEQRKVQLQLNLLQQQIGQQVAGGKGPRKGGLLENERQDEGRRRQDLAGSTYVDGQQLMQQGRFKEAIQDFNKALVLNPNNKRAKQLLAEAKKRLKMSGVLANELETQWDKAEAQLEKGELEETLKMLENILKKGASFGRNPKVRDIVEKAKDRKELISERLNQLRNWKRLTKERIQQQVLDKFQVKLGGKQINIEKFTCEFPSNPLVQTTVKKLLQQAKQDYNNLRKTILNASAFQESLGMEGLSDQFARVKNGRALGALPIPIALPSENRVGYSFELALSDKPEEIKFVFMNRKVSYFWQLLLSVLLLGGLFGLARRGLQTGALGFVIMMILVVSLQNIADPEYMPYLKTGLYAIFLFLPILVYKYFSEKIAH